MMAIPVFYVSKDDENDVRRCKESRDDRKPIAITGLTSEGREVVFAGVVQAVRHETKFEKGRWWRITMSDEKSPAEATSLKFRR